MLPPDRPRFGCLGITDDCMLRCRMCMKWQKDIFVNHADPRRKLVLDDYRRLFAGLREMVDHEFMFNIGGGEALTYPGIYGVIRAAADEGFRVNMNSNGFLINEEVATRLHQAGLKSIKLSLDSLDREKHDYLRGVPGVYDRVMRAIDNLRNFAPETAIGLIAVIYNDNYRDIVPLVEWADQDKRIEDILIMVPMQPNNTVPEERWWEGKYGYLWPRDVEGVNAVMNRLIEMRRSGCKVNNPPGQLRAAQRYLARPEEFVKRGFCNMDRAVHVSALGDIFICFEYEKIGDIRDGDIQVLWQSEKARQVRDKIRDCRKNCHFLINCFFEADENE